MWTVMFLAVALLQSKQIDCEVFKTTATGVVIQCADASAGEVPYDIWQRHVSDRQVGRHVTLIRDVANETLAFAPTQPPTWRPIFVHGTNGRDQTNFSSKP